MVRQRGASLIIVLALLSGALMLGVSGMNSALIDERLAGNYRASVQAQMTAENTLSAMISENNIDKRESYLSSLVAKGDGKTVLKGREIQALFAEGQLDQFDSINNLQIEIEVNTENRQVKIVSKDIGLNGQAVGSASVVYNFSPDGTGVDTGFVACNGFNFSGGNQEGYTVDAFNSRLGTYGSDGNIGEKAFLYSLKEGSSVNFSSGANYSGFAGVIADVYSAGNILTSNNNPVDGSFYSGGKVEFSGFNYLVTGDIYAESGISFNVGARVDGDVNSNEKIEVLGNWGEVQAFQNDSTTRPGTSFAIGGKAVAPIIYTQTGSRIKGEQLLESPEFIFEEVLNTELDVVNVDGACPSYGVNEDYVFFKYKSNVRDVNVVNWNQPANVSELGASMKIDGFEVFNVNRLSIGGNGLIIEEPTVIVAESDVSFTLWEDAAITLSDGASLKIITKGKTTINGNDAFQVNDDNLLVEIGGEIIPAYSLISLYDFDRMGVILNSGGDTYLEVTAPFTGVAVSSTARLLGRVFAGYIEVSGGGSLHYDLGYGSGSINPNGSAGTGTINDENLVWELSEWQ